MIHKIIVSENLPRRFFEFILEELKKQHPRNLQIFSVSQIQELKMLVCDDYECYDIITRKVYYIMKNAQQSTKVYNYIKKICNFTQYELEELCDDMFAEKYESFVVFGCKESTDIDVACVVEYNSKCKNGRSPLLKENDITRVEKELKDLGYDTSRGIDINIISIQNERIKTLTKGSVETANMITQTYSGHSQKYSCPKLLFVETSIFDKIRGLSSFFIQNLECLTMNYGEIRDEKKEIYSNGTYAIINFSRRIYDLIGFDRKDDIYWKCAMKSLVMKYCQLILLIAKQYEYNKTDLALKTAKILTDVSEDNILFYLFRGNKGEYSADVMLRLHSEYIKILDSIDDEIMELEIEKHTVSVEEFEYSGMVEAFLKSPYSVTDEIEKELKTVICANNMFILKCFGNRKLLFDVIGKTYESNFIWLDQRSEEWLRALTYYQCGDNSKVIPDTPEAKLNLIRGAITEMIVVKYFDFGSVGLTNIEKYMVGFVVAEQSEKALGCAPDLMILNLDDKSLIPVEIKCLKSGNKNSDYYRGLELAKKQCQSLVDILGGVISKGLVLLVHYENDSIKIESRFIDLRDTPT
jgi:hypothetical protein